MVQEEASKEEEEFPSPTGAISILIGENLRIVRGELIVFPSPTGAISILILFHLVAVVTVAGFRPLPGLSQF